MDWAQRIKDYRSRNGLTQEDMAERLDVDRTTIIRWEKGQDEPALKFRKSILALTPTVPEGVVRGLIASIDNMDGLATLLDPDFRVLRASRMHQRVLGYDPATVYGQPSERYWAAEMEWLVKYLGGLRSYKRLGIYQMDLALLRRPRENGFKNERPILSIGRTAAMGDPRDPICQLTTVRAIEVETDTDTPPPPKILSLEGEIAVPDWPPRRALG